jgi:transcription antitermination factor NusG
MFVKFDPEYDRWQQIMRAPGVLDILGEPTPIDESVYHDLVVRCPDIIAENDVHTVIPTGSEVEILDGALTGHRGVVSSSHSDLVWVELVAFNRLTRAELRTKHVRIV